MADYICKRCKYNNNGWCVALKKNKLSETIECNSFKTGKYGVIETKENDVYDIAKLAEIASKLLNCVKYDLIPKESTLEEWEKQIYQVINKIK